MSRNKEYSVWDSNTNNADVFESDLLKNNKLGNSPIYYSNVSGLPVIDKFGTNDEGVLSLATKPIDIDITTNSTGIANATYRHELGYRPEVIGSYLIYDTGDGAFADATIEGDRGMIPEERFKGNYHKVRIGSITNNELVITVSIDGVSSGTVKVRLYLLKTNAV